MDLRPEMSQLSLRSCLNPWKYTWLLFQSQDKLEISFSHPLAVSGASSRRDNELMGLTAYPGWKGSVWHNCSTDATWWLFVYMECKGHTSSSTWIEMLQHGNRSGGHRVHTNHQSLFTLVLCYATPCTLRHLTYKSAYLLRYWKNVQTSHRQHPRLGSNPGPWRREAAASCTTVLP